jgi:hypothetical protein
MRGGDLIEKATTYGLLNVVFVACPNAAIQALPGGRSISSSMSSIIQWSFVTFAASSP